MSSGGYAPRERFLETYSTAASAAAGGSRFRRYGATQLGTWNVLLLLEGEDADGVPGGLDAAGTDRAAARAFARMQRFEEELSRFQPESELSLVNALAARAPVALSQNLLEILRLARRFWERTGGAFDPTVAALGRAWGFDDLVGRVPSAGALRALRAACGMDKVRLDEEGRTVFFTAPGVSLDLGGIAKGFIVDRLVEDLKESGVPAGALLSGRSTIVVWGTPPGAECWRVAVAHPSDPDAIGLELQVEAGAISTSAAYERSLLAGGRRYGHVIDPRSGFPAERCLGATVWTPDATSGDALSTALFVAGAEEGARFLEGAGRASAIVLEEDSGAWGGIGYRLLLSGEPAVEVVRTAF